MSQPRMRKAPVVAVCNGARPRAAISKASGDPGPCAPAQKQPNEKRSRNKIPKSIRYDLENALVGLCDVWFEEIKPHLVRNNIKLHVHGAGGPAGGDNQRLPPGAPGCSHLDPALSAPGCELCRLLFNAANSIESAVSQAANATGSFPVTPVVAVTAISFDKPGHNQNSKEGQTRMHRSRRNSRPSKPPPGQSTWRVPRICHTYSVLSPPPPPQTILQTIQTTQSPKPRCSLKAEKKNKSTQTELFSSQIRCSVQQKRVLPNQFGRCTATTDFFPPKCKADQTRQDVGFVNPTPMNDVHQSRLSKTLFSKEFINVLGEKHDKRLKLLYRSPIREECASILNLVPSPNVSPKEVSSRKKRPWR